MVRKRAQLSAEHIDDVAKALSSGSTRRAAAAAAGVSRSTFYNWIQRGEEMRAALADETILGEPTEYELLCLELVDTVERSEGLAEYSAVQVIQQAAKDGSWQAAAWMLERRYPDDYARTTKQRHAGHDGKGAVAISVQDFQRHKEQAAREVDDLESTILNGGI